MPELRRHSLHDARLPLEYRSLLRKLDRFISDSLQLRPRKDEAEEAEVSALRVQHDELMGEARTFFGGGAEPPDTDDARRAFALGLYRCTYYAETVLGDLDLVDTCGSKTLTHFEVDTAQGASGRELVRKFLSDELAVDDDEFHEIEIALRPELESLALRQQVMEALERRHPLGEGDGREDVIWEMFGELYPEHPFRPGEIDVIRTGTSLFFCIPFQDLRLQTPGWDERREDERAEVEAFLRHWSKFKQRYYAHFPVFGFFRGEETSQELRAYLAESIDRPIEEITDALTTMVSILQSGEIDKYIVHDVWGHQWQSLLFRFEETYRSVARYHRLPDTKWRPRRRGDGEVESLEEIVRLGVEEGAEVAAERWSDYIRASLDQRLLHSLAGLVAEVLADAVEYKFILLEPEDAAELLSSSFFKDLPTKLDLTLWDLPWYFKMALSGYERFAESDEVRGEICADLAEELGLEKSDVEPVLTELARTTTDLLDFEYRRSLHYEVADGAIIVNAFCRVALNFLAMQATFNQLYHDLRDDDSPKRAGVQRFHDVLIFATASFFELDWYEHFWLVDEFLGLEFPKLWSRLER